MAIEEYKRKALEETERERAIARIEYLVVRKPSAGRLRRLKTLPVPELEQLAQQVEGRSDVEQYQLIGNATRDAAHRSAEAVEENDAGENAMIDFDPV
jgi:hypothetical protein